MSNQLENRVVPAPQRIARSAPAPRPPDTGTNGNLVQALSRFSEDRAVRILTIHKSKGLEFHSVILMGVERQAFFGRIDDERAAFFVGISRAKQRLVLTSVDHRPRPEAAAKRWDEKRTAQQEFLGYAHGL